MSPKNLFLLSIFFLFFICVPSAFAEDKRDKGDRTFSFGAIPVFSYDSDLGFKAGGVFNFFESGKRQYPDYDQYFNIKTTYTTRNTLNLQALFESTRLVRKATTILELTYTNDQKLDFFGFNGTESVLIPTDEFYYTQDRRLFRIRGDVQKNLGGNKLRLLTGFSFNHFRFKPVKRDSDYAYDLTLYEQYLDWGIISDNEGIGGNSSYFSLGLIYDTRNTKCNTSDGLWLEGFMVYAPKLINESAYTRVILTCRGYKSLIKDKWIVAVRLSFQNKLGGNTPFYMLPFYFDSQINEDGLGGAYSLRGITRNRIVADGFVLGNFETRIGLTTISLFNTDFNISTTFFCDAAHITQKYPVNFANVPIDKMGLLFSNARQKPAFGFGPGLNIIYNQNNIITVNYGFSSNAQLGNGGVYVGSKFLF